MIRPKKERRKYERYDTEAKIYFHVNYDIKTKVKFQVLDKEIEKALSKKYSALSKNISAEGLRFSSDKKVKNGDSLYLELYLPKQKKPVCMTGEVRWSKAIPGETGKGHRFDTGVKLITISGEPVSSSIYYDKEHGVIWSAVLDSIFGSFRRLMRKIKPR